MRNYQEGPQDEPDSTYRRRMELAARVRLVRIDLFGEHGGPEMARRLGLPARTLYNYETGVSIPAEIILKFIELTGVRPGWLLHGEEPRYQKFNGANAMPEPA